MKSHSVWTIAHRGASGEAPENTRAAFQLAVDAKAEMLELDLQLTQDEEVVVFHDSSLLRLTGNDLLIHECRLSDLKEIDIGVWFDERFSGERILTLEEVLTQFGDKIAFNFELKPGFYESDLLASHTLSILKTFPNVSYLISSYQWPVLDEIRKKEPRCRLGVLFAGIYWREALEFGQEIRGTSVHPECAHVTRKRIEKAHKAGLKVFPYVANTLSEMKTMIPSGVDGIMTDFPARLKKLLQELSFGGRGVEGP